MNLLKRLLNSKKLLLLLMLNFYWWYTLENNHLISSENILEIFNNENILSVGYQENVRKYLSISNALVFPSYREGFPNVVMEALAMKLPAIVTDVNGSNEICNQ